MRNSDSSVSKVQLNRHFLITFKAISGIEQEQGQRQAEEYVSIKYFTFKIFSHIYCFVVNRKCFRNTIVWRNSHEPHAESNHYWYQMVPLV